MDSTKVMAYDFFDTVVHRNCNPEQVLFEWSRKCSAKLDFIIDTTELYYLRKECENYGKKKYNKEEITYDQLMHEVYLRLTNTDKNICLDENDYIAFAKNMELDIEKSHVYTDHKMIDEIIRYKAENRRVILISDFYAGNFLFDSILEYLKLENIFDKKYISADIGLRKSSGNLYKYVIENEKINVSDLIMKGDNRFSDVKIPKSLGIKAKYRPWWGGVSLFYRKVIYGKK